MSEREEAETTRGVLHLLQPGEELTIHAGTARGTIAVTDRRLIVTDGGRTVLDLAFADVRRLQFDIERGRPATLVVVPEHPSDEPRVLDVPRDGYEAVATAFVRIGQRLV
jgi:hypothetical protein